MAEDLILKASLDTSEAEADAQKLKSSLAKVDGVSTSSNAGKALATNMNSARLASDAMFRSLQAMGGPIGRIAGQLKAFIDSARMLQSIPGGTGGVVASAGAGAGAARLGFVGTAAAVASGSTISRVVANGTLKANQEAVTRQLTDRFASDPSLIPENDAKMRVAHAIQTVLPQFGLNLDGTPFVEDTASAAASAVANTAASGLDKLASSSLAAQFKLMSLTSKLVYATTVVGTFAGAVALGLALQKKLYETDLQRSQAMKTRGEEFFAWMKDWSFAHSMQYGTEEHKRKVVDRELANTKAQLDAINVWRGSFDKEKQASGIKWTKSAYLEAQAQEKAARDERDAAVRKMKSGGAKLDKTLSGQAMAASVEAWWLEQSKKKVGLKDIILDLDLEAKKNKPTTKFTVQAPVQAPVTDELTRIGGSIGGGIDYQRSMANSLTSIDRAVAVIKSAVTGRQTQTPYI